MVYCEQCDANHSDKDGACVDIQPRKSYDIASEDSTYRVAIFARAAVESAYGPVTPDNADSVIIRLTGWARSYNGPGHSFSSDPSIRVFKRNIVIRQFCGLDI